VSPTWTSCDLPLEPLRLYATNHYQRMRPFDSNFLDIPPGAVTQSYDISVSNNNVSYSNVQKYTIFDSDCMDCHGANCQQLVYLCFMLRVQ